MKSKIIILLLITASAAAAQEKINFDYYFLDKTMRIDFFMTGDVAEEFIAIDQIYQGGTWAGNPDKLIDNLNNGYYYVKIYSASSNELIYSKGFSCIFAEYKTTIPAKEGRKHTYHESVLVPFPKSAVTFVLEARDRKNILRPVFIEKIDPRNPNIIKEQPNSSDKVYEILKSGDPHTKADFVFVAEGYRADEREKFRKDVEHFAEVLFKAEPYKSNRYEFNIYGVHRPSAQSGVDEPRQGIFRNTAVSASYNALELDRYLLVDDNKTMRDIAGNVPYDALIVMANTSRYGGGGIYNDYTIFTADDARSEEIFLHEFGHGFGGLADEYFSSNVSYDEFFSPGVEPTEGNITALLDPNNVKWKHLLTPGIPIPTPWGQEEIAVLQTERSIIRERLRSNELSDEKRDELETRIREIRGQTRKIRDKYNELYAGKIGVFEGAGYQAKDLYRSEIKVGMFNAETFSYGPVSEECIMRAIKHYTE